MQTQCQIKKILDFYINIQPTRLKCSKTKHLFPHTSHPIFGMVVCVWKCVIFSSKLPTIALHHSARGVCFDLIAVSQTAHAAHDTKYVVIRGEDFDLGRTAAGVAGADQSIGGQGQVEGGGVDAGHVAGAAGLVLLGLERERVHVDAGGGHVLVALVGLHQVEVLALALGEPVVAVQLQLGGCHGVPAQVHVGVPGSGGGQDEATSGGATPDAVASAGGCGLGGTTDHGAQPLVREVEPLLAGVVGDVSRGGGELLGLYDPN